MSDNDPIPEEEPDGDNVWDYTITIPHAPPAIPLDKLSDRLQAVLLQAGYTQGGGAPDVALVSVEDDQTVVMVNADSDPTTFLQQLATIPETTNETNHNNLRAQLATYRNAVAAGTSVTALQTARALAALLTILQDAEDA